MHPNCRRPRPARGLASLLASAVVVLAAGATALAAEPAPAPARPASAFTLERPADLVLTGGRVKTPTGWAEALAVQDGVIVAVGSSAEVDATRGRNTRVVDLSGATVIPGLHDTHVHPISAGLYARACRIDQGSTLQATLARVSECVARAAPGAWITGGQWDAPALGGVPDRAALDSVSKGHPVMLRDSSLHSLWVNSAALAAAGITRDTPNPPGGIIERDASGEPTGMLRESATNLVASRVPPPSVAETEAALEWAVTEMLSVGITSFTDAYVGFIRTEAELEAYASLADRGVLKQHVTLCLRWTPGDPGFETLLAARNRYARPNVAPDCIKIVLDGVPTDSQTAAMLKPYAGKVAGRDDDASRRGLLLVPRAELEAAVVRFDAMGLRVKFHAAGDLAARAGLDAIAAARRANGIGSRLHDVGHNTFVAKEDIARARGLGAVFEVSPYLFSPSPITDAIVGAVSPDLIRRVWPVREMLDAGALVVPGSDWNVVPSVDPWIGIETLVTREMPGGSARSFGKAEAITLPEAIDMFTVNAARQYGVADRVGRIETGMLADLIVLEQNPYEVESRQLHRTKVRMTFIRGAKVYDADSAAAAH